LLLLLLLLLLLWVVAIAWLLAKNVVCTEHVLKIIIHVTP
jgi:hypothetical protein